MKLNSYIIIFLFLISCSFNSDNEKKRIDRKENKNVKDSLLETVKDLTMREFKKNHPKIRSLNHSYGYSKAFDFSSFTPINEIADSNKTNDYWQYYKDNKGDFVEIHQYSNSYNNYAFYVNNKDGYKVMHIEWYGNDKSHQNKLRDSGGFILRLNSCKKQYFIGGEKRSKERYINVILELDSNLRTTKSIIFKRRPDSKFKCYISEKRFYTSCSQVSSIKLSANTLAVSNNTKIGDLLTLIEGVSIESDDIVINNNFKNLTTLLPLWNREKGFSSLFNEYNFGSPKR